MLERDAAFDDAVLGEIGRLRALDIADRPAPPRGEYVPNIFAGSGARGLVAAQATLAEALTTEAPTDDRAILRARGVLVRKRADDALPLLPELGPRLSQHDALSLGKIRETPRLPQKTAIADAIRIAESALEKSDLAAFAARDLAMLKKRFSPWWRVFG
jgi:uncharacterized protein